MSVALKNLWSTLSERIGDGLRPAGSRTACAGDTRGSTDGQQQKIYELLDIVTLAADWAAFIEPSGTSHKLSENKSVVTNILHDEDRNVGLLASVHVQDRVTFMSALSECQHSMENQECEVRVAATEEAASEFAHFSMRFRHCSVSCENSVVSGVLLVGKDIGSVLEDRLLEEKNEEIERADIAKTRFLANMSHELRTPLNSIIGFSEVLRSGVMGDLEPEKQAEYIGIINDSAQHLLSVLNDILNISKIDAGKYQIFTEPFNLPALVHSATSMFEVATADKDISLSVAVCEDLPEVTADSRAIKQILINLLSNAIKFTPNGGAVSVTVGRTGRKVIIAIEDTGIGISSSQIKILGQPFYQADAEYSRNYEGTGLGLSIVEGLLKLHGGSMDITSEVGKGTTICIEFPINCSSQSQVPADCDARVVKLDPLKKVIGSDQNLYEEAG